MHIDHIEKSTSWSKFYRDNKLPSTQTYLSVFGTWENLRKELGLIVKKKRDVISKETIKDILKKHGNAFQTRKQWDEYAQEHKLPTYKTILKHFTYEEILGFAGKLKQRNFSKEELISLALKHRQSFISSSMTKWDEYAKEHILPSSRQFNWVFGSWSEAKHEIRKQAQKKSDR
ncbi:hypothetical protein M3612_19790 [Niallia taxi]|uniref:hypothetical protein n=1 Tax=Niallia taxi TaxID=2499688 RepID=UPI00204032E1|nr:hypothetical protein [Niallia taxi]MCM3216731.1 hypothetical protein [Niallia taxi]